MNLIIADDGYKNKEMNENFDMSEVKIDHVIHTPDFFDEGMDLCDMDTACRDYGEGKDCIFLYRLSHIKKQFTNDGIGTLFTMWVKHPEGYELTEAGVKEFIMVHFAEYFI